MRARASAPDSGIVLLDIVIAMTVAALLALIVLPGFSRETTASRLAAYAAEVAAMLKADRSAATRAGREVATRIDVPDRRIASESARNVIVLPRDVMLSVVASETCPADGDRFAIRFGSDGRSCGAVITLAKDGRDWRIRVNWLTGFVDVLAPGQN